MLPTTMQAVRSILTADPSVNPSERNRLLSLMRRGPEPQAIPVVAAPEPRLIRRAEAARRLAVSVRCVDTWAKKGILAKRILPGHARASGFLESAVSALIHGAEY